ncbi:MAG: DEAD/DEAH box helicase family protein [Chitinispirillales bacterium]|jgi:superfamily II DNA or RNA helicase|nr:DEAD/DEAH box helicase family protein [Chitinispirillales bacterium]
MENLKINFENGTITLSRQPIKNIQKYLSFDSRTKNYRAYAMNYGDIVMELFREKIEFEDNAKLFEKQNFVFKNPLEPRTHQKRAIEFWRRNDSKGVIVMPTGAGKSLVARLAISLVSRNTLVLAPTLDLVGQWERQLSESFNIPIGILGGGRKSIEKITVSTYDSAAVMMEYIGNKFGFVIFDECHHLTGEIYRKAAQFCIAPFRLGLTATPESENEFLLYELIGKKVFHTQINELEKNILAPYKVERINVELTAAEQRKYDESRQRYLSFIRKTGINFSSKDGWNKFIITCFSSKDGKKAFEAYKTQKEIPQICENKIAEIKRILYKHAGEQCIIFTADNDTAYKIGRMFYLPVITHNTKPQERKSFLERFREKKYPILVTSKVLNEGVDVPEASVGIIVSGSGSIREHVQRLGRILRPSVDKIAVLYELIGKGTAEFSTSERRSRHNAYERFNSIYDKK